MRLILTVLGVLFVSPHTQFAWPYLRSALIGAAFAFVAAYVSYTGYVIWWTYQLQKTHGPVAVGMGAVASLQAAVLHSPLFWLVFCGAFGVGAYLSLHHSLLSFIAAHTAS